MCSTTITLRDFLGGVVGVTIAIENLRFRRESIASDGYAGEEVDAATESAREDGFGRNAGGR